MLNDSLLTLSINDLKNTFLHDIAAHEIAVTYVLIYVLYKALNRYIYFKPEEHSSKINRTFLLLSILVVIIHSLSTVDYYLPFLEEYRWLFVATSLILITAPFRFIADRIIWKYNSEGYRQRSRYADYITIDPDCYETTRYTENHLVKSMDSTDKNIPSDILMNVVALCIFIITACYWALESVSTYGWYSLVVCIIVLGYVSAIFIDRAFISWTLILEKKYRNRVGRATNKGVPFSLIKTIQKLKAKIF
jgi:hypothetical protein